MTNHTSNDEKRYPKPLEEEFERVLTPFQEFINDQRTGSVLLLVCTLSALLLANSPLAHDYEALVEMPVGFVFGGFANNPEALITAKTAILLASMFAGISGYLWLRLRV